MIRAGAVDVTDDERVTGDGLARELFDDATAGLALPPMPVLGSIEPPWRKERPVSQADVDAFRAQRLGLLRGEARRARAYAAQIVAHLRTNALDELASRVDAAEQRATAAEARLDAAEQRAAAAEARLTNVESTPAATPATPPSRASER